MEDSEFRDITSYFEFLNINFAKNVLYDVGPDNNIGSSSLDINILKYASNSEGILFILLSKSSSILLKLIVI